MSVGCLIPRGGAVACKTGFDLALFKVSGEKLASCAEVLAGSRA